MLEFSRVKETLKIDLQPECPVHSTVMVPATHWLKLDGKRFPKPIHVCTKPGCLYVYHASQVYYEAPESEDIGYPLIDVLPRFRFFNSVGNA
jgi:hypothetical protein